MDYLDLKSDKERMIIDLSIMGFKNVILLGHYSYKETKKKLEMHKHVDMLEICFLEKGSQYYQIGEENYLLQGGDILITHPNTIHGTSSFPEEKGNLFWMMLKVPKTPFKLLNLTTDESKILTDRLLNLKKNHFKGSVDMKKILLNIFLCYNKKNDPLRKIEITNSILNFLLKVIQCGDKMSAKRVSNDIEYCCKYIEENTFQKIYIWKLAEMVNLSESRFKHKFKEELGIPPNEYILKIKIKKAKELIRKKEYSITNLAYDLGFSTASYFSTVFKKYQGITPTEFKSSLELEITIS